MGEHELAVAAALKELEIARSKWMKSSNDVEIVETIHKHSNVLFAFALQNTLWSLFTWSLSSGQPRVANLVLDYNGLDIHTMGDSEQTLLHVAAGTNLDMTKRLVESGAKINATDRVGRIPLHSAVVGGVPETVAYLIEKGAEVNAKTKQNVTPLHEAVRKGTLPIITCLVEHGADVNAVESRKSQVPLHVHVAKKNPDLDVVKYLAEHGANTQVKDYKDRTVAQLARKREDEKHEEVAKYLETSASITSNPQSGSRYSFHSPKANRASSVEETTSPSPPSPPKRDITP